MTRFLPDSNIWLACAISGHPQHQAARAWIESATQDASILFARAVQVSVLRLLTTPAVFAPYGDPPVTNDEAWDVLDGLLADPRVSVVTVEPPAVNHLWHEYSSLPSSSPKRWMDAYLAALAVSLDADLVTTDTAFTSYPDLRTVLVRHD